MTASLLIALALASSEAGTPNRQFEQALDAAVRKVSRARFAHVLGMGESCRSYRLPGYGVVWVLAPRVLPSPRVAFLAPWGVRRDTAALERTIHAVEQALKVAESPELKTALARRLAELQATRASLSPRPPGRRRGVPAPAVEGGADALGEMERQAQAFHQEAERARREMERAFEQIEDHLRREMDGSGLEAQTGLEPPAPATAGIAVRDAPPAEPPAPDASLTPPWMFWFEAEAVDETAPDAVVSGVRGALMEALARHGWGVGGLAPEEHLVVAVDFYPRGAFASDDRPVRTLVVRARKQDLDAHRAGSLPTAELAKRIEVSEY
jgi:hypothetical protein